MSESHFNDYQKKLLSIKKNIFCDKKKQRQRAIEIINLILQQTNTELSLIEKSSLLNILADHRLIADIFVHCQQHALIKPLFILLLQQDPNGCNLGHKLAQAQNYTGLATYFAYLLNALDRVSAAATIELLVQKNQRDENLSHVIAAYPNNDGIDLYLNFLTTIAKKIPATLLGMLLEQPDNQDRQFGQLLARYYPSAKMKAYARPLAHIG